MVLPPELVPTPGSDVRLVAWTWSNPRPGSLSAVVQPDGTVWQVRSHPKDDQCSFSELGKISPEWAAELLGKALAAMSERQEPPPLPEKSASSEAKNISRLEVSVHSSTGPSRSYIVPEGQLAQHPALAKLRQDFIAVRKKVDGGFWAWRSLAGRMAFLFGAVVLMMAYWLIRDSRATDRLELAGQRIDAVVVEKAGKTGYDTAKYIKVDLPAEAAKPGIAKISEYLSAENWTAAEPGTVVRVWHDKNTGEAWLENDMQRWQSDKKWVAILPLSIGSIGLLICLFTKRYKVGAHGDGQEYLICGDRIAGDDKDAIVNRTAVNFGKMLSLFARSR